MNGYRIERYGRWWAVYDGNQLVCVAVYKKGALEVIRRLSQGSLPPKGGDE